MKVSTKGRYGLRIVLDIATHSNASGTPRLLREIADSQQLSEKYISRLVIALRNAGILHSTRGAKGGFHLAKPANKITMLEIIEATEGKVGIVDCICRRKCARQDICGPHFAWEKLNAGIREAMAAVTLQDIILSERPCGQCPGE